MGSKSAAASRRAAARGACPILFDCLLCVDHAWFACRARFRRRRNAFRLLTYFSVYGFCALIVFLFALILYLVTWGNVRGVNKECSMTAAPPTNNTDLMAHTLKQGSALSCALDVGLSACELTDLRAVLDMMLVNCVVTGLQLIMCLILVLSFRKFVDMPYEHLQDSGKMTRLLLLCGGICKLGPWLTRFLHFFQGCMLLGSWYMMVMGYCKGDLALTSKCTNFQPTCAYNKVRNCQYYYGFCSPNQTQLLKCFEAEGREGFSGRMDARLLTNDHCIRCTVLKMDMKLTKSQDMFWLLDDSKKGTDDWKCLESATECFHTMAWTNIGCDCKETYASVVSPKWASSLKCSSRRLELAQHLYSSESSLSEFGVDLLVSKYMNESVPHSREKLQHRNETKKNISGTLLRRLQASVPPVGPAAVTKQACSWAPGGIAEYFYDENQCEQAGSFAYRFSLLYTYFAGCIWITLSVLGQMVRLMSTPEPWFVQPRSDNEGYIFRFLRLVGP
eukprot:TRINITY_DN111089_c0_g1_i1.p1 TRINITY_DN111089_c0_g1~~TRINITY_DN111089_c0_g1_i1.p1  ORF type:complete len:504 (+),score=48.52 TRINITY_DN111089_c0_g1_i1:120-1631(+)